MASVGSPAETRNYIIERLVGETGQPERVTGAADTIVGRTVPRIVQGLATVLGIDVSIDPKTVELTRLEDGRPAAESHAAAVLAAAAGDDPLLLVMDAGALGLLVDAVFGGDIGIAAAPLARDPSPIELDLARTAFEEIGAALAECAPALGLKLPLPAPCAGPDLKRLILRDAPAVRIDLVLSLGPSRGLISVIAPQRVLIKAGPVDLGPAGMGREAGDEWSARFGGEVMRSAVELVATMPVARMTLGELNALAVGQTIAIDEGAQSNIRLAGGGKTLFTCDFGRIGQNFSVRVREDFDEGNIMSGLVPSLGTTR